MELTPAIKPGQSAVEREPERQCCAQIKGQRRIENRQSIVVIEATCPLAEGEKARTILLWTDHPTAPRGAEIYTKEEEESFPKYCLEGTDCMLKFASGSRLLPAYYERIS